LKDRSHCIVKNNCISAVTIAITLLLFISFICMCLLIMRWRSNPLSLIIWIWFQIDLNRSCCTSYPWDTILVPLNALIWQIHNLIWTLAALQAWFSHLTAVAYGINLLLFLFNLFAKSVSIVHRFAASNRILHKDCFYRYLCICWWDKVVLRSIWIHWRYVWFDVLNLRNYSVSFIHIWFFKPSLF
jgi:hypothetical protein